MSQKTCDTCHESFEDSLEIVGKNPRLCRICQITEEIIAEERADEDMKDFQDKFGRSPTEEDNG